MNNSATFWNPVRVACFALMTGLAACGSSAKDYVLVIDSSGSMSEGREATIERVKRSMRAFMGSVSEGDRVVLMSFDEQPRVVGTYTVNSAEDRAKVVEAVASLEARGRHTDMQAMVAALRQESAKLEGQGRNVFLVVMSDGKDDPPPGAKRKRSTILESIKDTSPDRARPVDDVFVYYVSLGKIKDPKLEASLKSISPAVRTVQAKPTKGRAGGKAGATDPAAGGKGKVDDAAAQADSEAAAEELGLTEVQKSVWQDNLLAFAKKWWMIGAIVLGVLLGLLLLFLLIRWFLNRHKVKGRITYYEADVGAPMKSDFDLTGLHKSSVSIGSKLGADIRVRQSGLPENVTLRAYAKKGASFLKTNQRDSAYFKALSQKEKDLISSGDRFRLGNYIFEYSDGGK